MIPKGIFDIFKAADFLCCFEVFVTDICWKSKMKYTHIILNTSYGTYSLEIYPISYEHIDVPWKDIEHPITDGPSLGTSLH